MFYYSQWLIGVLTSEQNYDRYYIIINKSSEFHKRYVWVYSLHEIFDDVFCEYWFINEIMFSLKIKHEAMRPDVTLIKTPRLFEQIKFLYLIFSFLDGERGAYIFHMVFIVHLWEPLCLHYCHRLRDIQ